MHDYENFDSLPNDAVIRHGTVLSLMGGIPRQTLARWLKAGSFPKPIQGMAGGYPMWRVGDIRAFIRGSWKPEKAA